MRDLHPQFERLTVASTINRLVDRAEDYYERGDGRADRPYDDRTRFFNNNVWMARRRQKLRVEIKR